MSFINDTLIILINIIHIVILVFVIGAPFSNSNYLILLHIIVVPFIMLHWLLNNNMCCLTLAEKYVREKTTREIVNHEDCFTHKLISPIYDFNKNNDDFSAFIYLITTFLWTISVYNFGKKYVNGQIRTIDDLAQI